MEPELVNSKKSCCDVGLRDIGTNPPQGGGLPISCYYLLRFYMGV